MVGMLLVMLGDDGLDINGRPLKEFVKYGYVEALGYSRLKFVQENLRFI